MGDMWDVARYFIENDNRLSKKLNFPKPKCSVLISYKENPIGEQVIFYIST